MKKICFFGTPEIAVESLSVISALDGYEVVGVGVFPDRKVGRKQVLTPCPVKKSAEKQGIPIFELSNKADLVNLHNTLDFDLGVVIAFGMIFPKEILVDGKYINVHFSLLPAYRGASPVQSAILDNQKISGITWQRMVYELDAGNVLWQKEYNIEGRKTSDLWPDFAQKTAENFGFFLDAYFSGEVAEVSQDEKLATFCGKFDKTDGLVDFENDSAEIIYNKYRAFDVWPGIYVETTKGRVKLLELELLVDELLVGDYLCVKSAENSEIFLKTVQLAGKKPIPAVEFVRNYGSIF